MTEPTFTALYRQLYEAADRRDWDACIDIEKDIKALRKATNKGTQAQSTPPAPPKWQPSPDPHWEWWWVAAWKEVNYAQVEWLSVPTTFSLTIIGSDILFFNDDEDLKNAHWMRAPAPPDAPEVTNDPN